jgi:hypothetical protein
MSAGVWVERFGDEVMELEDGRSVYISQDFDECLSGWTVTFYPPEDETIDLAEGELILTDPTVVQSGFYNLELAKEWVAARLYNEQLA